MNVITFQNISKKYKLYNKGGLYLRDRISHSLHRLNRFNGSSSPALGVAPALERDFWALKNVSFEIKQGESVGFIGRNGAGKSTILKLLAGVTKPSSGSVNVNGRVAALIEVGAGFHPELTGRENVYLNGSILGMKKAEIAKVFDDIVSFAELEDFMDTPVKHYSSGMYVRLGFAIAAHTNPDIFLIDEVLAVGDESFQKKCIATLAGHKMAGKTMVLVSHDLAKIQEVCDRCIYLDHGSLKFDGSPANAITHYKANLYSSQAVVHSHYDKDGEIEIVDVKFRNSKREYASHFNSNDDLLIEVQYRAYKPMPSMIVAFSLHGPSNENVFGVDSRNSVKKLGPIEAEGFVYCQLGPLPLRTGKYQLSVSLRRDDWSICDFKNRAYDVYFDTCSPFTDGLLNVKADWSKRSTAIIREPPRGNSAGI